MSCELRSKQEEKVRHEIGYGYHNGVYLSNDYLLTKEAIENFEVRNDDVWIIGYPKSGTTWIREMAWCIANDLDYEGAKVPLGKRFFWLDLLGGSMIGTKLRLDNCPELSSLRPECAKDLSSPRFIQTHYPFNFLPSDIQNSTKNPKIIYIARNPKDVCISHFHHIKTNIGGSNDSFEEFCDKFLNNQIVYTPYWESVISYWKARDTSNILFLTYKEMKKDLPRVIRKTAAYLGKSLSDDQVETLSEHLSFNKMKSNPAVNRQTHHEFIQNSKVYDNYKKGNFMRKGEIDQWKTEMTEDLIKRFDEKIETKLSEYPELIAQLL